MKPTYGRVCNDVDLRREIVFNHTTDAAGKCEDHK